MRTPPAPRDGNFLEMELHHQSDNDCHIDLVYLESPKKRTTILTEKYASKDQLREAFVNSSGALCERARKLCPAIGLREESNLAKMKDLPFEPLDVRCDYCGSRPGEPCDSSSAHVKECLEDRQYSLRHFLIWLAEQRQHQTKLTKKLIIDVAERLGYNTAENLYYRDHGVVVTQWSTGNCWRLYVGGRLDPTKSVWMTSGADLSNPESGPFRDAEEIALAVRAVGRGE